MVEGSLNWSTKVGNGGSQGCGAIQIRATWGLVPGVPEAQRGEANVFRLLAPRAPE